jgi:hypothetical protein
MRAVLVAGLVALAMLAGCSDGKDGDGVPAALVPEAQELGLQATKETGVIVGVVLDRTLKPLPGATVRLGAGSPLEGLSNTTNDRGAFGFDKLPPGVYVLHVTKSGYNATTAAASVVAARKDPEAVKVLLDKLPGTDPFVEYRNGVLSVTGAGGPVVGVRTPSATEEGTFSVRWEVTPGARFVQGELHWAPTTPAGTTMYFYCGLYDVDAPDDYEAEGVMGSSPLVVRLAVEQPARKQTAYCGVWPDGDLVSVAVEQRLDVYAAVFHNMEPEAGWTLGEHGPHPL